ncbi:MAG: metallophosphoesterase [Clostridia bacterium]|nr:metallophosphoesterase [Clostridia bacterium]
MIIQVGFMKKTFKHFISILIAITCIFSVNCKNGCKPFHFHKYDQQIKQEEFLKEKATCQTSAIYYYSCKCGAKGEETFNDTITLSHDFSARVEDEKYLKTPATCQSGAEYYFSCTTCGLSLNLGSTFKSDKLGEHVFDEQIPDGALIKDEATETSSAVYYKSCICGAKGTDTFTYGEPLRDYNFSEKQQFLPTSLTISLYDTENSIYGFTYNTSKRPLRPVIQIAKGSSLENYEEYPAHTEEATSSAEGGTTFKYYISKIEVPMNDSSTYTYRIYDKYVKTGTQSVTITTKDLSANSFSFAHVSDSQHSSGNGNQFGSVLSKIVGVNDFVLHTGDVVEWSEYEDEWKSMLHGNFAYLSKLPIMAISGNHETTYQAGSNETYKHFNNKIPYQTTKKGYFYSFTYGNAKFIMLNTNVLEGNKLKNDQYEYLVNELKNNDKTWTFVALHNPLYSAGSWGSNPAKNQISLSLQKQLSGIFAEYGVDVVLQGHDHVISRTLPIKADGTTSSETWNLDNASGVSYSIDPDGVIYVLNGPASNQTRSPYEDYNSALYYYAEKSNPMSWADFKIEGNTLTVTVNYFSGTKVLNYKTWGIKKSA